MLEFYLISSGYGIFSLCCTGNTSVSPDFDKVAVIKEVKEPVYDIIVMQLIAVNEWRC